MSKKLLIIVSAAGVLLVLGLGILFVGFGGPDLREYESLRSPRLAEMPGTKVIEVRFSGNPDQVIPAAFRVLMQSYFGTAGVKKGPGMSIPAARYQKLGDRDFGDQLQAGEKTLKDQPWTGVAAIPVPDLVTQIKAVSADGMESRLGRWEYGPVAEILHVGSYETEWPQTERLKKFIAEQGYEICGPHEEVYLRGPGQPFVKPANYYTIIRYQVKKRTPA